jgi:hypothetical protein
MTDLLSSPDTRRTTRPGSSGPVLRPLALGAALAGLTASAAVLVGCMALALVGWFASDAGAHGDTKDAIRVGADGWLMSLGAHLHLATGGVSATITAAPLGLTLLCAYVAYRLGSWAALTSAVEDLRGLAFGVLVMSGLYGVVALVTAVLAATSQAEPSLLRSFVGGFALCLVFGGLGLLRGSSGHEEVVALRARVPEQVRAIGSGAVAAVMLVVAAAAVLLAVALLLDLGTGANVLSRLHADTSGGLLYVTLVAAVAPNAVLLSGSYLLGPGFALGTGTVVSPSAVVLGPVPAFPLLAALPSDGTQPVWLTALVAVPVLAGAAAAVLAVRRYPAYGYETGAVRGLGAGALGGVLLTALTMLAGGAVGPGRMADTGVEPLQTAVSAVVAMGIGGLVGGVAATWRVRRTRSAQ